MTRQRHISRLLATLTLFVVALFAARAQAAPCADAFERLYPENGQAKVRTVKGVATSDITYGLEGETKAAKVYDWYRPANTTDAEWLALPLEERVRRATYPNGYVKTANAPEWLQDKLSSDPGGAELISKPTDKLETALAWINTIEQHLGKNAGGRSQVYWQGNIAYKRGGEYSKTHADGIEGYVRATGDYAQFRKLEQGYALHLTKPEFIPGKNLGHFVLGPLNTTKMGNMAKELEAAKAGRSNDSHDHYIQGTYFRTWAYGPDRNGFEVRDPHKDVGLLKQELRRLTNGLEKGFTGYEKFKAVSVLDETGHFNQFPDAVKTMLGQVDSRFKGRYALPMKPFEQDYPTALGMNEAQKTAFTQQVTTARREYVQTLERIAGSSASNPDKVNQARVALGKFAYDTKLASTLDGHFGTLAR